MAGKLRVRPEAMGLGAWREDLAGPGPGPSPKLGSGLPVSAGGGGVSA